MTDPVLQPLSSGQGARAEHVGQAAHSLLVLSDVGAGLLPPTVPAQAQGA